MSDIGKRLAILIDSTNIDNELHCISNEFPNIVLYLLLYTAYSTCMASKEKRYLKKGWSINTVSSPI